MPVSVSFCAMANSNYQECFVSESCGNIARMASDMCRLDWRDFGTNLQASFRELHRRPAFADVSLVCQGEQVEAHRVVLAASSSLLGSLLRRSAHPHPLLLLHGMEAATVRGLLQFIYTGQATVPQGTLAAFLEAARQLQVT